MAKKNYEEKYTHPEMREEIKEEIQNSDRGGEPGQWSARKAQLLSREYEKRGGGYKGEKDEEQKNLEKWTEEEWQTREGEARARTEDGTSRYLPREAWEKLSEEEKEEAEWKKREGSKKGEQYVDNPEAARKARREATLPLANYDDLTVEEASDELEELSKEELEKVRAYEKEHKQRKTLLELLDRRIQECSERND